MLQHIGFITVFIKDYDEALQFYMEKLGFVLLMDTSFGEGMRWVTVAPSREAQTGITLMIPQWAEQEVLIGRQNAGIPLMTLNTDDIATDFEVMSANGVHFLGEPHETSYGTDVVFEDLYGNLIDLVQRSDAS